MCGRTATSAQMCYRSKNIITLNDAERVEVVKFLEAMDGVGMCKICTSAGGLREFFVATHMTFVTIFAAP